MGSLLLTARGEGCSEVRSNHHKKSHSNAKFQKIMKALSEIIYFSALIACSHTVSDGAFDKNAYQQDIPNEYDYEYDDGDVDTHITADSTMKETHRPVIITQPTHVQVPLGGFISLPCQTDFLPESVQLIWSKLSDSRDILVIGETILPTTTNRMSVTVTSNGSTLLIKDIKEDDYGHFQCKVAVQGTDASQVIHTVSLIEHKKPNSNNTQIVNAKAGDNINLSCSAVAHPEPSVTWSKENGLLPDSVESVKGNTLILKNVTAQQSGTYVCVAENGVSKPVKNKIQVFMNESDDNIVKRGIIQGKLQQYSSSRRNTWTLVVILLFFVHFC